VTSTSDMPLRVIEAHTPRQFHQKRRLILVEALAPSVDENTHCVGVFR